jgi:putative ABC transport system permease protein
MTAPTAAVVRGGLGRAERPRGHAVWALAARLARREVRRRKGRTALVVALVAIPVIAMTIASVVYRTTRDTSADLFARQFGSADLVVWGIERQPGYDGDRIIAALPQGSRVVDVHEIYDFVAADHGAQQFMRFTDLPLADPITAGMVDIERGRAPVRVDEVLLSPDLADRFGVDVGEALSLDVPAETYDVVGIGRPADSRDGALMVVVGFDFDRARTDRLGGFRLVDTPPGFEVEEFVDDGDVSHRAESPMTLWVADVPVATGLAWGWVGGVLALTVMGIVIAAAFATSARRQLVTLGQLAANGADRSVLRRMLALQGAWSGSIGSVLGIVVGLVLILPNHGLLERIANRSLGGMEVAVLDLVIVAVTGVLAATVAAFVPSRSITKVPVLSALGGRRPLGPVPRWLVPCGVAMFAGGVALVAIAAAAQTDAATNSDRHLFALVAVVGGLGVLFGMCCSTPAIIAVLGPIGERSRATARLAARSTARGRTRSAAIVTAIAAAGALSIGGGTAVASAWGTDESVWSSVPYLQSNMVSVQAHPTEPAAGGAGGAPTAVSDPGLPVLPPVPSAIADEVRTILPAATEIPVRTAGFDLAPYRTDVVDPSARWLTPYLVVADPPLVDALGLSPRDRALLEQGSVLAGWEGGMYAPSGTVRAHTENGTIAFDVARLQDRPRMSRYAQMPLISPGKADALGLPIGSAEVLFVASDELTSGQRNALDAINARGGGYTSAFLAASATSGVGFSVEQGHDMPRDLPRALIDALIVVAALLFILAVVAVGLALSAAESRDERDVLLAVGAPPRAMRRVSAQKAVLLTAIGGVLAVPTGFMPVAVVMAQTGDDPIRFPWLVALGCVVAVPLLVGAATFAGSAVAQRLRPVHMSTLAAD